MSDYFCPEPSLEPPGEPWFESDRYAEEVGLPERVEEDEDGTI